MDKPCGPAMIVSNARSHASLLRPARQAIRLARRAVTSVWRQQHVSQSHLVSQLVQHEPQHALGIVLLDMELTTVPRPGQVQDAVIDQLGHKNLCGGGRCGAPIDHQATKVGQVAVVGANARGLLEVAPIDI